MALQYLLATATWPAGRGPAAPKLSREVLAVKVLRAEENKDPDLGGSQQARTTQCIHLPFILLSRSD